MTLVFGARGWAPPAQRPCSLTCPLAASTASVSRRQLRRVECSAGGGAPAAVSSDRAALKAKLALLEKENSSLQEQLAAALGRGASAKDPSAGVVAVAANGSGAVRRVGHKERITKETQCVVTLDLDGETHRWTAWLACGRSTSFPS